MAAVHTMKKNHERDVAPAIDFWWHKQSHIGAAAERGTVEGHLAQAVALEARIGKLDGSKVSQRNYSIDKTALAFFPANMSSKA
jgi:hypothetical protein